MGLNGCGVSAGICGHIVIGHAVGHWTAARVEGQYFEQGSQAIGLEHDGKIIAGVIYEHWNQRSIVCHMAVEGRLTRQFIWMIFDYAYNQIKAEKVILPVASANKKSVKLVLNMGFREEARLSDAHPTGDLVFFTMSRGDCRFLWSMQPSAKAHPQLRHPPITQVQPKPKALLM